MASVQLSLKDHPILLHSDSFKIFLWYQARVLIKEMDARVSWALTGKRNAYRITPLFDRQYLKVDATMRTIIGETFLSPRPWVRFFCHAKASRPPQPPSCTTRVVGHYVSIRFLLDCEPCLVSSLRRHTLHEALLNTRCVGNPLRYGLALRSALLASSRARQRSRIASSSR